ncbi:MAG: S8 family serine peptidase [Nitrososphaeraceae archaeon]|nr:S8 family serine peptidase [Nitrososphaeraceae archaeon]
MFRYSRSELLELFSSKYCSCSKVSKEVAEIKLDNGTTAGTIQSGISAITPIWNAGLHGENQIIGIVDSTIDISHCFFCDDPNNTIPQDHRKIIGLRNSSGVNPESHGTFVAGIVVGDDLDGPSTHVNKGIAWAACLTFGNSSDLVVHKHVKHNLILGTYAKIL